METILGAPLKTRKNNFLRLSPNELEMLAVTSYVHLFDNLNVFDPPGYTGIFIKGGNIEDRQQLARCLQISFEIADPKKVSVECNAEEIIGKLRNLQVYCECGKYSEMLNFEKTYTIDLGYFEEIKKRQGDRFVV